MARAMFEYTKMILKKVSFDTNLFCTEVKKAMERLLPYQGVCLGVCQWLWEPREMLESG